MLCFWIVVSIIAFILFSIVGVLTEKIGYDLYCSNGVGASAVLSCIPLLHIFIIIAFALLIYMYYFDNDEFTRLIKEANFDKIK